MGQFLVLVLLWIRYPNVRKYKRIHVYFMSLGNVMTHNLLRMLLLAYQTFLMYALNGANLLKYNALSAVRTIWCALANVFWK